MELWSNEGDKNTQFFHASTINRRKYKKIELLKIPACLWLKNREDIGAELCDYFSKIMNSNGPRDLTIIKGVINPCLNDSDNEYLISIPSFMEVKEATFQIGSLKACGPDGYPAIFLSTHVGLYHTKHSKPCPRLF